MLFKKLVATLAMVSAITVASVAEVTVMTENYPPFNYTNSNGQLTGFSTEIIMEIQKRLGYGNPPEELPWSRGYALVQKKPNHALYSMTRNEAREKLFKWVGPLVPNKSVLWGLADKEYNIKSIEDAKQYTIGTYKDDADEIMLKEMGGFKTQSVVKDELNLKKLLAGKIDLWIGGDPSNFIKAKEAGVADKIKRVFIVSETQMYLAFNPETPDEEVAKWQATLDQLKEGGFYQKVWDKYFK